VLSLSAKPDPRALDMAATPDSKIIFIILIIIPIIIFIIQIIIFLILIIILNMSDLSSYSFLSIEIKFMIFLR
jgi:hypothetical protein